MASIVPLPRGLRSFFERFPLHTYASSGTLAESGPTKPQLWVLPPKHSPSKLSAEVVCLRWQTYLALRGAEVAMRYDIATDGGLAGRLPVLQLPHGELLSFDMIASWVEGELGRPAFDGFKDAELENEQHAWFSLLDGPVSAALVSDLGLNIGGNISN